MKTPVVLICFLFCFVLAQPINAQESPSVEERSDSVSPDKQWEYKCVEYDATYHQCEPEIVKPGTSQLVLDLGEEEAVHNPEANEARVVWAPDSKRFAFNYSPVHAHHTTYKTVAFYELRGDKWAALRAPEDAVVQFAKDHVAGKAHRSKDKRIPDVLKTQDWTDSATVTMSAIWYGEGSDARKVGYTLTLKFAENGSWKILQTRRLSAKENKELED